MILHLLVLEEASRVALRIGRDVVRGVVVQPEEVGGALDEPLLLWREGRQPVATATPHARGVLALVDRLGEPAQLPGQRAALGRQVGLGGGEGLLPVHVQGHADPALLLGPEVRAVALDGPSVRQDHVVRHGVGLRGGVVLVARSVLTVGVAQHRCTPRLVDGAPVPDPVAKLFEAHDCIALEVIDHLFAKPATILVLQDLRQVPMVDRHHGRDLAGDELVEQRPVELDRLGVDLAPPGGQQARPGDGEAVGRQAYLAHEFHILAEPVVVVAGHCTAFVVRDLARNLCKRIPYAGRATVLRCGALNLVGCCRGPPEEVVREPEASDRWRDVQ
mmetsp:Transcript_49640/g.156236  ORF Transcript_49640/g.156236 Transcript_49640/m.156236 type:complete len:332 (-) Transcript_49640:440-1435(-)